MPHGASEFSIFTTKVVILQGRERERTWTFNQNLGGDSPLSRESTLRTGKAPS